MLFAKTGGRQASCWCCPLLALCCATGSSALARAQTDPEANRALAVAFLDRYSLGYGLLYACGKSPLPAFLFDHQPPQALTLESAGSVSTELLKLIIDMHSDPDLYGRTCDLNGPLARHFAVPELSNELLEGLRSLNHQGSGRNAFENGVYFRIRGHDSGFERYARRWHRTLEQDGVARR